MPATDANPRFLFFSQLVGRPVVRTEGSTLGRVADLVVVTGEPYPPVESVIVRARGRELQLPWTSVTLEDLRLTVPADTEASPAPAQLAPDRLRLGQAILDRQIVDVEGAKLVRVNDLHFLHVKEMLRLAHVDVGFRGLVRRLGWERIADGAVSLVAPGAHYLKADHLLSWKLVQPLDSAPGRVRLEVAQRALASIHPADLAEIMEELDRPERVALLERLDVETAADALEEASPEVTTQILEEVPPERAADILEEMAPDEAADALGQLPGDTRRELLEAMERPEAREVQELLEYPPRSAGGLMTPDVVELRPAATVADALGEVRRRAEEVPMIYEVFVTDPGGQLRGVCTLKDLVTSEPGAPLSKIMHEAPATVPPTADMRDVAEAASKYNLFSVPVVDTSGVLKGVVTVDDILAEVLRAA